MKGGLFGTDKHLGWHLPTSLPFVFKKGTFQALANLLSQSPSLGARAATTKGTGPLFPLLLGGANVNEGQVENGE